MPTYYTHTQDALDVYNSMFEAVASGNWPTFKALLTQYPRSDIEVISKEGKTFMQDAVDKEQWSIVMILAQHRSLMREGHYYVDRYEHGSDLGYGSALWSAAQAHTVASTRAAITLVQSGAPLLADSSGETALHIAARKVNLPIVKALLGLEIDGLRFPVGAYAGEMLILSKEGKSAREVASDPRIVGLFRSARLGSCVSVDLHEAITKNNVDYIRACMINDLYTTTTNYGRYGYTTPLEEAALQGKWNIVEIFAEYRDHSDGHNLFPRKAPDDSRGYGLALLHAVNAAAKGDASARKAAISILNSYNVYHACQLISYADSGDTALHIAARAGDGGLVEALLKSSSFGTAEKNKAGDTPEQAAIRAEKWEMVRIFKNKTLSKEVSLKWDSYDACLHENLILIGQSRWGIVRNLQVQLLAANGSEAFALISNKMLELEKLDHYLQILLSYPSQGKPNLTRIAVLNGALLVIKQSFAALATTTGAATATATAAALPQETYRQTMKLALEGIRREVMADHSAHSLFGRFGFTGSRLARALGEVTRDIPDEPAASPTL